jgi:hypothetical protein
MHRLGKRGIAIPLTPEFIVTPVMAFTTSIVPLHKFHIKDTAQLKRKLTVHCKK